ncbi:MAG: hypothetical protein KGJ90_00220 [Patescibacteria group bacterium]|nr:hypothetical protein [Patescibacteria group bacterium]
MKICLTSEEFEKVIRTWALAEFECHNKIVDITIGTRYDSDACTITIKEPQPQEAAP